MNWFRTKSSTSRLKPIVESLYRAPTTAFPQDKEWWDFKHPMSVSTGYSTRATSRLKPVCVLLYRAPTTTFQRDKEWLILDHPMSVSTGYSRAHEL